MDLDLDIMGQQPGLFRLYTELAFVFALDSSRSHDDITTTLTRGLERLSESFPWVAGQVVNTSSNVNMAPAYKIRHFRPTPQLFVKDYTTNSSIPTFDQLKEAQYPFSMLSESIWAPCPTLQGPGFDPLKPSGDFEDPAPVMLLQANFIKDGFVLCINMQHNTTDMTGQGKIIELLSRACRGEAFTEEEIRIGNMERKGLVPLLEENDWNFERDLAEQLLPSQAPSEQETTETPASGADNLSPPQHCSWSYYVFSASSLKLLKDLATNTLPKDFQGYITTDDALTAFIYQSVLRARQPRLSALPQREVTFARAVDARKFLNIPASYTGILQNMTYSTYSLDRLLNTELGEIAAGMRLLVDPKTSTIHHKTRSLVTFLSQSPENFSKASFTASLKVDADIMLSSWCKINAYHLDFGLGLGLPESVRRPAFVPVESLLYLMPKARDGEIAVAMALRDEDLERLNGDQVWTGYAKYIG